MSKGEPHVHAEVIKAWADGAEIEWLAYNGLWVRTSFPSWNVGQKYRVYTPPSDVKRYGICLGDIWRYQNKNGAVTFGPVDGQFTFYFLGREGYAVITEDKLDFQSAQLLFRRGEVDKL